MEGRKDTRKAQFKSIVKLVDKNGVVVGYPKYDSHATSKELVRAASKRGCPLTLANAAKIVDYVGTDLTALQNEIDKLCAYADGKEITIDMINDLVHVNLETKVYYISNYIIKMIYKEHIKSLIFSFIKRQSLLLLLQILQMHIWICIEQE